MRGCMYERTGSRLPHDVRQSPPEGSPRRGGFCLSVCAAGAVINQGRHVARRICGILLLGLCLEGQPHRICFCGSVGACTGLGRSFGRGPGAVPVQKAAQTGAGVAQSPVDYLTGRADLHGDLLCAGGAPPCQRPQSMSRRHVTRRSHPWCALGCRKVRAGTLSR